MKETTEQITVEPSRVPEVIKDTLNLIQHAASDNKLAVISLTKGGGKEQAYALILVEEDGNGGPVHVYPLGELYENIFDVFDAPDGATVGGVDDN